MITQECFFEVSKISFIIISQLSSFIDLPILFPLKLIILLAIPPTKIILSNLGIKFFIIPIFVEIFDPPIIQVIGFLISVVTFFNAFISVSSCNPAKDGINFVILLIDA